MMAGREGIRVWSGSEIRAAVLEAVEAIHPESEITEFHAGENMMITLTQPELSIADSETGHGGGVVIGFTTLAWTGTGWTFVHGS